MDTTDYTQIGTDDCVSHLELFGLAFAFVQHLGQRLQLRQCQLQRHPVVVSVRRVLQQVLSANTQFYQAPARQVGAGAASWRSLASALLRAAP